MYRIEDHPDFNGWRRGERSLRLRGKVQHKAYLRWLEQQDPEVSLPLLRAALANEEPNRLQAAALLGLGSDATWQEITDAKRGRT